MQFKPMKGASGRLDSQSITEGYCWFTFDDGLFYIDYKDDSGVLHRKALNAEDSKTLNGASLSTTLNASDTEIPSSKSVSNALSEKSTVKLVTWTSSDMT